MGLFFSKGNVSVAILLPWNHTENQNLNYYNPVNRVYWYVSTGAFSAIPETSRYFKYTQKITTNLI
ncbi:hypothetical protein KPSB59_3600002 [Klebsiella quasipneumoniae subsp. quasipneumoniae]|nr:hypothetical protein KPSB59_3600002 [Klebsiella quasipneumoniae subsp. quasipneumoniae]CDQ16873.1 conserved hypothetical protein [Klebsiella quasipneumoniae subsp. quasipneumoniae]